MFSLLVVGKDLNPIGEKLREKGFKVFFSRNGHIPECEVALVDVEEETYERVKLVRDLKKRGVPVIVFFNSQEHEVLKLMKEGVEEVLLKDLNPEILLLKVERFLKNRELEEENKFLKTYLFKDKEEEFLLETRNPKFKEVLEIAHKVATADSPVLIKGETGVGKEVLARYIHKLSHRRDKPFIVVDCSAIPEELFESELFGYEKGAFTGATKRKPGLVEVANKGTLFLDEIGDMPLSAQSKLLRFVETKKFRRVGGIKDYRVDVRIVCATNKDLRELIAKGKFREDLYYRINTVELEIPPLRERKEDIPLLVEFFLKRLGKKIGKKAMRELMEYPWRGNVRELKNTLERASLLSNSDYIDDALCLKREECLENLVKGLPSLKELELRYTAFLYEKFGGNVDKVAEILGCSKRTVFRKLKEARERGMTV